MPALVILIHGAWAGGWVWDAVTPLFVEAGFSVLALDLPGTGPAPEPKSATMAEQVAFIRDGARGHGGRVFLVAHSGGGLLAGQVAEADPDHIAGIVYIAGHMLPDGLSFADLVAETIPAHPEAAGIRPFLQRTPDGTGTIVPRQAAMDIFFGDCPVAAAEAAAARLTPQPDATRSTTPSLTASRFGRVPRLYVEAAKDRSVVLVLQRRMQALVPGAERVTLDTGHVPQLAAPDRLAAAIIPWLQAQGDR